jgi:hypothetical protein
MGEASLFGISPAADETALAGWNAERPTGAAHFCGRWSLFGNRRGPLVQAGAPLGRGRLDPGRLEHPVASRLRPNAAGHGRGKDEDGN